MLTLALLLSLVLSAHCVVSGIFSGGGRLVGGCVLWLKVSDMPTGWERSQAVRAEGALFWCCWFRFDRLVVF